MTATRQLLLGALFLTSFGILAVYTLYLYDLPWLGDRTFWRIEFPAANGLRVGDSVRASGMQIGRVTRMSFDPAAAPDRRISVTVSLETPVVLREGYAVEIQETTLLGGRNIDIETGPTEAPVFPMRDDTVLRGTLDSPPLEALTAIGDLVSDNREAVYNILDNVDALVAGVRGGQGTVGRLMRDEEMSSNLNSGVDRFSMFMDDASAITTDIRAGKGTLGKLFTEEELYRAVEEIAADLEVGVDDLRILAADLKDGKGTIGRFLRDDGLADTVQGAIEDIDVIVERARAGEGTLGRFLADDEIANRIESIATRIDEGEGVLGALIADDEMYRNLKTSLGTLSDIFAKVQAGEGTVGKLIQEEEIYKELLAAVQLLTRSLEDYREAAPVSTFTSVLFGAF